MYQESGTRWTVFVALWTTGLGYGLATLYYQAVTYARSPGTAAVWIAAVLASFAAAYLLLRWIGRGETAPLVSQQA